MHSRLIVYSLSGLILLTAGVSEAAEKKPSFFSKLMQSDKDKKKAADKETAPSKNAPSTPAQHAVPTSQANIPSVPVKVSAMGLTADEKLSLRAVQTRVPQLPQSVKLPPGVAKAVTPVRASAYKPVTAPITVPKPPKIYVARIPTAPAAGPRAAAAGAPNAGIKSVPIVNSAPVVSRAPSVTKPAGMISVPRVNLPKTSAITPKNNLSNKAPKAPEPAGR